MSDLFEKAVRAKLRYDTDIGALTTEQLWDLPLTSRSRPDLDKVARAVFIELKGLEEASFVESKPNPMKVELELKLDVVKRVIEARLAEKAAAEKAAERAERKRRLLSALAAKEDQELQGMSKADIEAAISAL